MSPRLMYVSRPARALEAGVDDAPEARLDGAPEEQASGLRPGMSLVEVVIAMIILTGVLLALGSFTAKFAQAGSQAHLVINANELAVKRLDAVRQQPTYAAVDTLNTVGADIIVPFDGMIYFVNTKVVRKGGSVKDTVDYKIVTVTVTHKSLAKPVTKTTAVAAF